MKPMKSIAFRKLFEATFGVSPVLGPELYAKDASQHAKDPATRLGYQLLLGLPPSCPYKLQNDAGWPLQPQTLRYLDGLASEAHEADSVPTEGPLAAVAQVRSLAERRDRRRAASCSVSYINAVLHTLSVAILEADLEERRDFTRQLLTDQSKLVRWVSKHLPLT